MGEKRPYKPRKPGGGRKKLKPEYDAGKNLKEQMDAAVALYDSEMSLQAISDELGLNPIPLWEKIMDRQGTVCCTWEKTAFEEGLKVGIRLMMEVYRL